MKIGIVTHYYNSENYGGNLQAYALCRVIQKLGYDVEQISYNKLDAGTNKVKKIKRISKRFLKILKKRIKRPISPKYEQQIAKRKQAILHFNKNIVPHSEIIYNSETIKTANRNYDVFITGSDQVWHPLAVCPVYLLEFVGEGKYKFSYAASIAKDELSEQEKKVYKTALRKFDNISVREEKASEILGELLDEKPSIVLDPTLLLTKEDWDDIASASLIKEKYLFCYFLGNNKISRKLAEEYARKHHLKLVTMPYLHEECRNCDKNFGDEQMIDVSPEQFISLIKYADCIFTDSFHACVFSAIYKKDLFAFRRNHSNSMASRIYTFTKLFGIEERFCDTDEKETIQYIDSIEPINYAKSSRLFEQEKYNSIEFLKSNLENAQNRVEIKRPSLCKEKCTGCGACKDICPVRAIDLVADSEGFLYPLTDAVKCIQCGKCDKICPVQAERKNSGNDIIAYAARTKNEEVLLNSSSGGIFTEFATYIIKEGGVVFGAAFDKNFKLIHIGIDNMDDLDQLRGSKYVQSEIGDSYIRAREYLDAGRLVLFTGTPCQIGGLHSFLGRQYDNLYTQDLICHGVPSPMIWQKYIEYRESKAASSLRRTFFRHKKNGWKMFSVQFEFSNCTEYIQTIRDDLYMCSFLQNLSLRPSCYNCAFKTQKRQCDISLADFWGVDKIHPEMDDDKGTSLIVIHSDKGKQLFESIKENLLYLETDLSEALKYNSAMTSSVPKNERRSDFIRTTAAHGFSKSKKFVRPSFVCRIKKIIRRMIKKS